jgi:hypothetical protein
VLIDLANRAIVGNDGIVRLSLVQMVIGSDDNIEILPEKVIKKDPKVPEFDIRTIDGTSGEPGTTGITGANGANGPSGSTGANGAAGANGANGSDGAPPEEPTMVRAQRCFLPSQ